MHNFHKLLVFSLLIFSFVFATVPITCETDEDCQELNEGNVCMDGICGFAQEPADETVDNCYTEDFCISEGYDLCTFPDGGPGSCDYENPYGEFACTTDEYCQENNIGSECTNGVCAYVQPPEDTSCFTVLLILSTITFSLFAFGKK